MRKIASGEFVITAPVRAAKPLKRSAAGEPVGAVRASKIGSVAAKAAPAASDDVRRADEMLRSIHVRRKEIDKEIGELLARLG
jgi:hypothetical protein